jgi:hypothetical protein
MQFDPDAAPFFAICAAVALAVVFLTWWLS